MRGCIIPVLAALTGLAIGLGTSGASAESPIATEALFFEKSDPQANAIARAMYGKEFSYVRAVRVWLEPPSDAPEQLFVQLGKDRDCDQDCTQIALFHNGQWLEIYNRPAARSLGLTEVKTLGMKSIIADGRVWFWNATRYVPEPIQDGLTRREATEAELKVIAEQIGPAFEGNAAEAFGPPELDVYDVTMNGYLGKIIAVRSPYVCGQTSCPIYLLNARDQIFRVLRSLEGDVGLSRTVRDEKGFRGIELLTRNGISIVSSTSGKLLGSVPIQDVQIAGETQ